MKATLLPRQEMLRPNHQILWLRTAAVNRAPIDDSGVTFLAAVNKSRLILTILIVHTITTFPALISANRIFVLVQHFVHLIEVFKRVQRYGKERHLLIDNWPIGD